MTDPHADTPDLQLLSRAVFAASVHSVVIADARQPDLPIIYVNPAFERLSGYAATDVIGRNCRFLQGPDRDQTARLDIRQATEQGHSVTALLRNYRRDGTLFINELTLSPILDAAGAVTHFVGFQIDVTAREAATALLDRLQGLTQRLAAVHTQDEVAHLVLYDALEALEAISGTVLLAQGEHLHVAARRGQSDVSVWQAAGLGERVPSADALRSNTPVLYRESGELTAAYPQFEARTGGVAAVASAVLPMVEGDRPLGVIVLDFQAPHDFTVDEEYFLRTLAGQCGLALDRAKLSGHLEQAVQDRTAELEAFVRFTEAADGDTDVLALAGRAVDVLSVLFPGCTNAYYALEDELWKLKVHTRDLENDPILLGALRVGMPVDTPAFADPLKTGQPVFIDGWDPKYERSPGTAVYQSIAISPVSIGGTPRAMFAMGFKGGMPWSEHHKAVFRAVGRSLGLALERTETARKLKVQNAELLARTQALEGFAALTRDLGLTTNAEVLIERALALVHSLLPPGYAVFTQIVGERWRPTALVGDVGNPELQAAMDAGFPVGQIPSLDLPYRTREPLFQDHYDPADDIAPDLVEHLSSVATLPVVVGGKVIGLFNALLFGTRPWSAADQAMLRTTVHSLGLALERAEQARQLTAQRDLLQAANEELEAFTYSVSHDLRTPVRHIISFGDLLRRELPTPLNAKAERYFGIVRTAADTLSTLIDGMLDVSRTSRQPLQAEQVNLKRLFTEAQQKVGVDLPQRQIDWQISALPTVVGDAELLRRVITALVDNAVKFTRNRDRGLIEIWAEDQEQSWTVLVRDNGVGFNPQYRDKLFSMFQRLHRAEDFEGAAVSLANARRIMTRHGGTMTAEGQPGQGATFGFILPKAPL